MLSKFLHLIKAYQYQIYLGICIFLISIISYNLGKINSFKKSPITIEAGANIYKAASAENLKSQAPSTKQIKNTKIQTLVPKPKDPRVVASKASKSRLYHFTWCSGAKQIKLENQLWFDNEQAAIQTGYKLASNCKP